MVNWRLFVIKVIFLVDGYNLNEKHNHLELKCIEDLVICKGSSDLCIDFLK